jgi:hypothetical protein
MNHSSDLATRFSRGEIVLRLQVETASKRSDVGMVISREDFEQKLNTHLYQPLLFTIDLPLKLSYLYGCLHYSSSSHERTYVFQYRELGSNVWKDWFRIPPYADDIYHPVKVYN